LVGAVLVLGFAGCAFSGDSIGRSSKGMQAIRYTIASVLGVTALVAALVTLSTGNPVWLAVLVAATVAIWATTTTFHLLGTKSVDAPRVSDRELVGRR
jgi:hypothetical protein